MTDSTPSAESPSAPTTGPGFAPRSRWRAWLATWLLLTALSSCWAVASPLSSAPDEPAHLKKAAAVARLQFLGEMDPGKGNLVNVPVYIAKSGGKSQTCFVFKPEATANCVTPLEGDQFADEITATSAGLYNPVYYAAVGWPSLLVPDQGGVYAMRIASAALCSALLALTVVFALSWRRPAYILAGLALAFTPMVFYLGGAVNPQVLETAGITAAFAGLLTIARNPRVNFTSNILLAALAGALAVNARGLSPLWLAGVVVLAAIAAKRETWTAIRRSKIAWLAIGITTAASAFGLLWLRSAGSLTVGIEHSKGAEPGASHSIVQGVRLMVGKSWEYWHGLIANFGWLDTPVNPLVYQVWTVAVAALLIVSVVVLRGRTLVTVILLALAAYAVPVVIGGYYYQLAEDLIWQGRYSLPLYACLMFGAAALISDRVAVAPYRVGQKWKWSLTSAMPLVRSEWIVLIVVAGVWVAVHAVGFVTALRRYAVGATQSPTGIWAESAWQAPGGNLLWIALYTAVLVLTVILALRLAARTARPLSALPAEQASPLTVPA